MTPIKHLSMVTCLLLNAMAFSSQAVVRSKSLAPRHAFVAIQASKFKSYREWKGEMVTSAQGKVNSIKAQIDTKKSSRRGIGTDPNLARGRSALEAVASQDISVEKLEKQLREEQYDLEVANDLSVTDYFAGYLTKIQDKKAAFKEVAGKLSPEEVAELMNAYANSVFGAHASDLPVSAANTTKESGR